MGNMENVFEKQGIQFKIIDNEMIPPVLDFMWEHFIPYEPISRSLGDGGVFFADFLKDGCSIAALEKDGNIIGARIGMRKMNLMPLPENTLKCLPIMVKLFTLLDYDIWKIFDKYGCDLIYEGKAVCSARTSGVRGLGTELCRRAESLAKDLGCTHTYAAVTGKYSRRIFEKLGYTILSEVAYADFKDEDGELYLKDTQEHLSIISCIKKL